MKVNRHSQLAVKWANGQWTYYRVSPYRRWAAITGYFRRLQNFRFAILYAWNKDDNARGQQIGYFDKHKDTLA